MVSFLLTIAGLNLLMVSSRTYNCSFFKREDPPPRIMVTGGAGFIGSTLVKRLKGMGYPSVKIVDNFWRGKRENLIGPDGSYVVDEHHDICVADLTQAPHSMHVFRNIDWVIHLADAVAGISFVFDNQSWLFRENILINTNVVTASSHHKASKFIYVGTACSFPQEAQEFGTVEDPAALDENQIFPAHPESSYGWSKLMGEYEVSLMLKMNTSVLRLHNVYGPGADYADLTKAQALPAIIRKAINSPAESYTIWGSGKQYRDFVFVDDVVDGLVAAMQKDSFVGAVQIGTSVATSLQDAAIIVANLTAKCLGKVLDVQFDTLKRNGDQGRVAIIKKAQNLLSWTPKVSIAHGLSMNYAWILRDMASKSNNNATLLRYALCLDKESEIEKSHGWKPPVRQAKGYNLVLPRPPGDISAVLPHFFCENERRDILKHIAKNPPPRKTLVVLLSSTRAGHVTFESFVENVLEHLNADLALSVESQEFASSDAYRSNATYLWEINPPQDNDYLHFYNEISTQCFNHPFDESYASLLGQISSVLSSGWLGCIGGSGQPACSGQIIFYRWFALQNIIKNKLYEKYDTVIISRSDELWVAPYNTYTFPVKKGTIYVPKATDWGGLSDRHYHMSMYDAINTLSMADIVVERENPADQVAYLRTFGFSNCGNLESANKLWHVAMKRMNVTRYNTTCMLVGDSSDSRRENWGMPKRRKVHKMYFNVKYAEEYALLQSAGLL